MFEKSNKTNGFDYSGFKTKAHELLVPAAIIFYP